MRSVKGRIGAEEDVMVRIRMQHGFQASLGRAGNGPGRQAVILIGIVGRVYQQVRLEDAPGLVVEAISDGGIGLEFHARVQAVQVNRSDGGHLGLVAGFAVHDGGQRGGFLGRKSLPAGCFYALLGPPQIAFLYKTVHDVTHRCRPKHLVGVGNDYGEQLLGIYAIAGQGITGEDKIGHSSGIGQHLRAYLAGQDARRADGTGKRQVHRGLPAFAEHARHIGTGAGRIDKVVPHLHGGRLFGQHTLEAGGFAHQARSQDAVQHLSGFHPGIDVQVHATMEIGRLAVVPYIIANPAADENGSNA